ncbi:MAG: endonuclease/exonuclease/phosphatase family protein [Cyclobacteriaceae bacterium]
MRTFKVLLIVLSVLFFLISFLPLLPWKFWWIKGFVFPRIQISALLAVLLLLWLVFFFSQNVIGYGVAVILLTSLFYQGYRIYPYTFFARNQTSEASNPSEELKIDAITANVYMKNRQSKPLLEQIRRLQPDLVLLLETDQWWKEQMDTLKDSYTYTLSEPLDNTYGMLLYSRLPLHQAEIRYLIEDSIPSMHAYVELRQGKRVRLYCLHPKPPVPPESTKSTERDAELLLVGKMVNEKNEAAIVMGDLNDVAWSYTTRLFLKTSQMLDPRIGRGFFNTYNANYPLMRWSLDHVFHTESFQLNDLRVLPEINSDHFPIYFSFSYEPDEQEEQEPLEPNSESEEDSVNQTIEEGLKSS